MKTGSRVPLWIGCCLASWIAVHSLSAAAEVPECTTSPVERSEPSSSVYQDIPTSGSFLVRLSYCPVQTTSGTVKLQMTVVNTSVTSMSAARLVEGLCLNCVYNRERVGTSMGPANRPFDIATLRLDGRDIMTSAGGVSPQTMAGLLHGMGQSGVLPPSRLLEIGAVFDRFYYSDLAGKPQSYVETPRAGLHHFSVSQFYGVPGDPWGMTEATIAGLDILIIDD